MAQSPTHSLATALTEFQASLTPEQKDHLLALSTQSAPDANAVLVFTAQVDRTNQRRKSRCVASRLQNTLQFIQQFSGVVDTFVSADPSTAALAWGSVKVTILAASNFASYFDKLSQWFIKLESCCPRYAEYQFLFADAPRLQKALCEFFATVIQFCKRSIQIVQKTGVAQFAKSLWKPFDREFGSFEEQLQRQSKDVQEEISLASEKTADRERQLQIIERKAQSQHRTFGRLFHDRLDRSSEEERSWRLEYHEKKIKARKQFLLDKLSKYDYISALKQLRKKRYGTTSTWLKKTLEYELWLNECKSSSFFWLSGILGSGKSVLTAALIDELLCNQLSNNAVLGFFFCQHDHRESLEPRTILGSLVRQFLTIETMSETMQNQLERLFTDPLFSDELGLLLETAMNASQKYFIVIDGFDECSLADQRFILSVLKATSSSHSNIKIFISGRHDTSCEIEKAFDSYYYRTMNCQEVHKDIEVYIKTTIEEKRSMGDLVVGDVELLHDIEEALIGGARGMFLWVFFQVEDICEQTCDEDIRQTIQTLPADLPQTFERALARIVKSRKTELVIKIFGWVAAVNRPLSLNELREAIALKPCQEFLKSDQLINDLSQLVSWCANLIIVDENYIHFAHHTVKEYFLSDEMSSEFECFRLELSKIDQEAGEICVTYLNLNNFKTQLAKYSSVSLTTLEPTSIAKASLAAGNSPAVLKYWTKLEKYRDRTRVKNVDILQPVFSKDGAGSIQKTLARYSFLAYASKHWLSHTSNFTAGFSNVWRLWKTLVQNENTLAERPWTSDEWSEGHNKVKEYIVNYSHWALLFLFQDSVSDSYLGGTHIKTVLLDAAERADDKILNQIVNQQLHDQRPSSYLALDKAVKIAAESGRVRLMEALLSGTRNIMGIPPREAMIYAARSGDQVLISRLLCVLETDSSISYWAKCEIIEDALLTAKEFSQKVVILRLIDRRSDIKACRTAIQKAAAIGDVDAAKSLVDAKADVNALPQNEFGLTALQSAARHGHIEIAKILIGANADIFAWTSDSFGFTALAIAAEMGEIEIVKLLIASKADVNFLPSAPFALTPLQAAAKYGFIKIVHLLIAANADVNAPGARSGLTALQAAVENGHKEVVKLLVVNGADVNASGAKTAFDYTALQVAARYGHLEVAQLFLGFKANINAKSSREDLSALQLAAKNGHVEMVELLIAEKAHVNSSTTDDTTALIAAAEKGHIEIVKLLLGANARVDALGANNTTALKASVEHGHVEIVKLLIAENAGVEAWDFSGLTSLSAVAAAGHFELVKLLIAQNADIDAQDFNGLTALSAAAAAGHVEIVKLLIAQNANVDTWDSNGLTALIAAAAAGHIEIVKLLIAQNINVNARGKNGLTALNAATAAGHIEIVKLLIAQNASVSNGLTALIAAAAAGHIEILKLLIAQNINVNARGKNGLTALNAAIAAGHIEIVKLLIAQNANVYTRGYNGSTKLSTAAAAGHIEIVKLLTAQNANVNALDSNGFNGLTALSAAAAAGHIEIVKLLIAQNANVNALDYNGMTALSAAAAAGHIKIVKLLTAQNANIEALDSNGLTALNTAVDAGHIEIVKFLIAQNANVNALDYNGITALSAAAAAGHIKIVKLLIAQTPSVNAQEFNGLRPLSAAAAAGHIEIVNLLMAQNADVEAQDSNGLTALSAAAAAGHIEIVKLLIAQNANVDARRSNGWTALSATAAAAHVNLLIEQNADVDDLDYNGLTALSAAADAGHIEIVKLLIEQNADVDALNYNGVTALGAAAAAGHIEVVKLLIAKNANVNARAHNGLTALSAAAARGRIEIVKLLIAQKAEVNTREFNGLTALGVAANAGRIEIVKLLKAAKGDADASDVNVEAAVNAAVRNGHARTEDLLRKHFER